MTLRQSIKSFVIILVISFLAYLIWDSLNGETYGYFKLVAGMIIGLGIMADLLFDVIFTGDIYGKTNIVIVSVMNSTLWWILYTLILLAIRDIKSKWGPKRTD